MTTDSYITVCDWREGETSKCPVCGAWSLIARTFTTSYCPKCDKTVVWYTFTWGIENGDTTTKEMIAETRQTLAQRCDNCLHLDGKNDCVKQHTHIRHPYKTTCKQFFRLEATE